MESDGGPGRNTRQLRSTRRRRRRPERARPEEVRREQGIRDKWPGCLRSGSRACVKCPPKSASDSCGITNDFEAYLLNGNSRSYKTCKNGIAPRRSRKTEYAPQNGSLSKRPR